MKFIAPYAILATLSASIFGQEYQDLHLEFAIPQVLIRQMESALTNGVPCSVIVSNISLAPSFQPVSALGACLDFDFTTNDVLKTSEAFATRTSVMNCLFGTNTYFVSTNLYSGYLDFCTTAFSFAEKRDKSIAENWFTQHPLEPIDESMPLSAIMSAKTRNNEIIANFELFMNDYFATGNPTSAFWRIYYNYNKLIYFGPRFIKVDLL